MGSASKSLALLLVALFLTSLVALPSPTVEADLTVDDWAMFHHDPSHTGYSTSSVPTTTPVVLWTTPKGYGGSPVVANGYVYILDVDYLYCFSVADGHQVWNKSASAGFSDTSPAVYGDYVYTPLGAYNAYTGKIVLNYSDYKGEIHGIVRYPQ